MDQFIILQDPNKALRLPDEKTLDSDSSSTLHVTHLFLHHIWAQVLIGSKNREPLLSVPAECPFYLGTCTQNVTRLVLENEDFRIAFLREI